MNAWTAATIEVLVTPTPSPTPGFDVNQVTPGVVGFAVTAGVVVVTILLIIDMVRRMRRVRYREEARDAIAAELASTPVPDDPDVKP